MLKPALLALALLTSPVAAQPLAGDPPDAHASAALDATLDAVVHDGGLVMLWEALPAARGYAVQTAAPGGTFTDALVLDADPVTDVVGYSARLDLPEGQYAVRLVAIGADAVTTPRALTVEAPDAFFETDPEPSGWFAARD